MRFEIICGVLIIILLCLIWKIVAMRRAVREIQEGIKDKLETETNTLLTIDSRDRQMRALADAVNADLRRLRAQRQKYEQGNLTLRENITNISHDIRTPLTAICGYLELLEEEEMSEKALRYLAVVKERTETLKRLTEELFVYAMTVPAEYAEKCTENGKEMTHLSCNGKRDSDLGKEYENADLNRVLEESVSAYYGALKTRGIIPQITMPKTAVLRKLNPAALSRVFENILGNAVKYSAGDLQICLSESGQIIFSNHAPSLDEVQVGRLFDKFYTVENAAQSTGLGLAIARLLTEQMGGRITAQYADEVLTITVLFPEEFRHEDCLAPDIVK